MAIGNVATQAMLNSQAAQLATQLRTNAQSIAQLQAYVVGLGQAGLVALGFTTGDATALLNQVSLMNTLALIYVGSLQQGGTGGTGASLFNFQNALVTLTGPF